mmetsp:Transcript_7821/g.29278  ORF Transcript_7821/g.29278 Transcript_7821/m.29278 type:complete len:124 (+) Transcript_7821:3020-3391(+)
MRTFTCITKVNAFASQRERKSADVVLVCLLLVIVHMEQTSASRSASSHKHFVLSPHCSSMSPCTSCHTPHFSLKGILVHFLTLKLQNSMFAIWNCCEGTNGSLPNVSLDKVTPSISPPLIFSP